MNLKRASISSGVCHPELSCWFNVAISFTYSWIECLRWNHFYLGINYPNPLIECLIRVFWYQVYILLEYLNDHHSIL